MAEEVGCVRPTAKAVEEAKPQETAEEEKKESIMSTARVGLKAPDFEAPAYHKGKFTTVKLADYLGKWVMICFYPGDFTFV